MIYVFIIHASICYKSFKQQTLIIERCSCWLKRLKPKFNTFVEPQISCNANDTVNSKSIERLLFEIYLLPEGNPVRILSAGVMYTQESWTERREKEQQFSVQSHWPLALPGLSDRAKSWTQKWPRPSHAISSRTRCSAWPLTSVYQDTLILINLFLVDRMVPWLRKSKAGPWFVLSVWHPRWGRKCRKPVRSCVTSLKPWIFTLCRRSPLLCYS